VSPFSDWESFYVIIGSSAAGLTGLQFVVIALIADRQTASTAREIDAFGTPTIVHFGVVLLLSGILTAPWHGLTPPAFLLGACGAAGLVYSLVVIRRARHQTSYAMVFEDWLFFALLPLLAYTILTVAAWVVPFHHEPALFAIAVTVFLLLFIGIHNAWDTVTFIAVSREAEVAAKPKSPSDTRTPPSR
jgi:hypothetical protein